MKTNILIKISWVVIGILLITMAVVSLCFTQDTYAQSGDFAKGEGTAEDPYRVSTAQEFDKVRYYSNAYFQQTANLDMLDYENFAPIGSTTFPFTGRYDGDNYSINNLTMTGNENNVGLFSFIKGGEVIDVKITNAKISGKVNVGALVGTNKGVVKGCVANGDIKGDGAIGGIVGLNSNNGVIEECGFIGNVSSGVDNGSSIYSGGIAGINTSTIKNCYNQGDINTDQSNTQPVYSGGIAGLNNGESSDASIIKSYNVGSIGGDGRGQIAGDNINGKIDNCIWQTGELDVISTFNSGTISNTLSMLKPNFSKAESFEAWSDFTYVWMLMEDSQYPSLRREYVAVDAVEFETAKELNLQPGESSTLSAKISPVHATFKEVIYEMDDPNQAATFNSEDNTITISENAAIGSKIIVRAKADGVSAQVQINVAKIAIERVELVNDSGRTTIANGLKLTFSASTFPDNASFTNVTYSVNTSYASITQDGVLTINDDAPIGLQITVMVTSDDNKNAYDSTVIEVVAVPVESVTITADDQFKITCELKLNATVLPNNATNKEVIFEIISSTASGAQLINNTLYAQSEGTITVVARAEGVSSKEFVITVVKESVSEIKFDMLSSFRCDGALTLNAFAKPDNATYNDITYSIVSDTAGATIIDNVLYAEHDGTVIVRATADGVYADKEITVEKVAVDSAKFTIADSFKHTQSLTLDVEILPKNATYKDYQITIINNTAEAYILDNELYAKKPGEVMLRVEADGVSDEITITVLKEAVTKVTISAQRVDNELGECLQFSAQVLPTNATYQDVEYFLKSGPATLSEDGLLLIDITAPIGSLIEVYAICDGVKSEIPHIEAGGIGVEKVFLTADLEKVRIGYPVTLSVSTQPSIVSNPGVTYDISSGEVIDGKLYVSDTSMVGQRIYVTAIVDGKRSDPISIDIEKTPVETVVYNGETSFKVTDQLLLSASAYPTAATYRDINYTIKTDNGTGATISDGYLFADKPGEISLNVGADGESIDVNITVEKEPVKDIVLNSLKSVKVNKELILTSTVYPFNATNKSVTYELVGNKIGAEIYNDNILFSENVGEVTVRVSADGIYRDFTIEITKEAVTNILLNSVNNFKHTEKLRLSANVLPFNATYKEITYEMISGQDFATLEDGYLYADRPGVITIRLHADGIYRDFDIEVVKEAVTGVELIGEDNLKLNSQYRVGEIELGSKVYPSNATYTDVTYSVASSSDNCTASVNNGMLIVTLNFVIIANGLAAEVQATVTISATADGVTTTRVYTVNKDEVTEINLTHQYSTDNGDSWSDAYDTTFKTSARMRFDVSILSELATYKEFEMKWSSSSTSTVYNGNDKFFTVNEPCTISITIRSLCSGLTVEYNFNVEEEPVAKVYLGTEIKVGDNGQMDSRVKYELRGYFTPTANYDANAIGNYKDYSFIEAQQGTQLQLRGFAHAADTNLAATYGALDYLEFYYVVNNTTRRFTDGESNAYFTLRGIILTVKTDAPVTESFYIYAKSIHGDVKSLRTEIKIQSKFITEINEAKIDSEGKIIGLEALNQVGGVEKVSVSIRHSSGIVIDKDILTKNPTMRLQLFNPSLGGNFAITYTVHFYEGGKQFSYVLPEVKEFAGLSTSVSQQNIETETNTILFLDLSTSAKSDYDIDENVKAIFVNGNGNTVSSNFVIRNDKNSTVDLYLKDIVLRTSEDNVCLTITGLSDIAIIIQGEVTIQGENGSDGESAEDYEVNAEIKKGTPRDGRMGSYGNSGGSGIISLSNIFIKVEGAFNILSGNGGDGGSGGNGEGSDGEGVGEAGRGGDGGHGGNGGYGIIVFANLKITGNKINITTGNGGTGGAGGDGGNDTGGLFSTADIGGNGGNGGHGGNSGCGIIALKMEMNVASINIKTGDAGAGAGGGRGGDSRYVQPIAGVSYRGAGGAGGNGGSSGDGIQAELNISVSCTIGSEGIGGSRGKDGEGGAALKANTNKAGSDGSKGVNVKRPN